MIKYKTAQMLHKIYNDNTMALEGSNGLLAKTLMISIEWQTLMILAGATLAETLLQIIRMSSTT